ncbi:hypothetical protein TrispH2_010073 [Trichoplax sp. H2]|nr:hypothetical protein TrispH2_010073 [Trichoplax sp. H2]|eukprot:RDD39094.1 hypothetical protein TrispH2_010073 [Trichoplax sp. H2]
MRYAGVVSKPYTQCNAVMDAKSISFDKSLQYDRSHSPNLRKYFLVVWINLATDRSLVYLDDDQVIQQFGAIRKGIDSYKNGTLYAESFQMADSLIHTLAGTYENCKVVLDAPIPQ